MFIPRLLELGAPVAAMKNIIQSGDGFNHQKMANRRGGWRGDFTLINKPQLGEKLHRVFTGATGHALNAFLTCHRLGSSPSACLTLCPARRDERYKANGRFIVGINIQSAYRYQITLLVDDHLVMRHRIPRVAFRTFG